MKQLAAFLLCTCATLSAASAADGSFAKAHYTTPLADICPNPFIIQKDWLAQPEQGFLYQLIGAAGVMSEGRYQGALGATGIDLVILEGGPQLGDGETAYSALYMGNSRADLIPHLAFHELDNAFIFSARFPAVGVIAPLDKSPTALFWDPASYPEGFANIDDLKAFANSGSGKIYVSSIKRTFGRYLVEQGIPADGFVEGYQGDGETFVTNNGAWLQQGFVTNEVYKFETGNNWAKPLDYLLVSDLGYSIYTGMLAVATGRMEELAPCLEALVPLVQRATRDYVADPAEVNGLIAAFNEAGHGASFWKTSPDLLANASKVMLASGVVSNGSNQTLGDFDMDRVEAIFALVKPLLDERAAPDVSSAGIVTNRFIDPAIGLP